METRRKISTVEMHTGGENLRIVISGLPEIAGKTILDKMKFLRENHDDVRKMLMHEPRGHSEMFGVYLVDADVPGAAFGCIFIHNEGYGTMCGDAVISLGRYAVDYGIIKQPTSPETRVLMQCPCGPVESFVEYKDGKTGNVRFNSVPSFLYMKDLKTTVPGIGEINLDICYGGAFYAYVEAGKLGMKIKQTPIKKLVKTAGMITDILRATIKVNHPVSSDLAFIYGTVIVNDSDDDEFSNLCVFAEKQVDRSPCGSGTTGRIAQLFGRGLIKMNEVKKITGPAGASFYAKVVEQTKCGPHDAVIVEVAGKGQYMGTCEWTMESDDEIGKGFLLR